MKRMFLYASPKTSLTVFLQYSWPVEVVGVQGSLALRISCDIFRAIKVPPARVNLVSLPTRFGYFRGKSVLLFAGIQIRRYVKFSLKLANICFHLESKTLKQELLT